MALPIVIAKNQTGSPIYLPRVGVEVPASPATITLTDYATFYEISSDSVLNASVNSGDIIINDGTSDLSAAVGDAYLDATGNLNGPTGSLTTDTLPRLDGTTGRYLKSTGITVDNSDNMGLGAGNITTTGNVTAGTVTLGSGGTLILPLAAAPAQTANGSVVWDSNDFLLTIGDGSSRKTMVDLTTAQTLTTKTLTAPTINGGTHTALTSLGIRSTGSGAFDLTLANTENLTVGRTLTLTTGDASRTINISGAQGAVYYTDASGNLVPLAPGTSGQFLKTQGAAANPIWDSPTGAGDVVGPASATDNALVRFDGTTGKLIQDSTVTLGDLGSLTFSGTSGSSHNFLISSTNTAFYFRGNRSAASATADIELGTNVTRSAGYITEFQNNTVAQARVNFDGSITASVTARTSGTAAAFLTNAANHTNQTTATEISNWHNQAYTRQWATGAIATQREVRFATPTYSFVGASVITDAANLYVGGAPAAGTNATITNAYALWVDSGTSRFDGDVQIPNTGLKVYDTNSTHFLSIVPGSNLTADRTLTLTTGDSARTIDLTGAQGAVYYTDASGNLVPLAPGTSGQVLQTNGAAANPSWATVSGGGASGTTTVDFGSAATGSQQAEAVIAGQASITGTSKVHAWVTAVATADHNAAEHTLVPFRVVVRNIVAATGFTIQVISDWDLNGTFTVQWEWV